MLSHCSLALRHGPRVYSKACTQCRNSTSGTEVMRAETCKLNNEQNTAEGSVGGTIRMVASSTEQGSWVRGSLFWGRQEFSPDTLATWNGWYNQAACQGTLYGT